MENKNTETIDELLVFFKIKIAELSKDGKFVTYNKPENMRAFFKNTILAYNEMNSLLFGQVLAQHDKLEEAIVDFKSLNLKIMDETIDLYRANEKAVFEQRKGIENE